MASLTIDKVETPPQKGGAETTAERIAAIEGVITELERRQRHMVYARTANRHSRQQAVNTTGHWEGPVGKRMREGVHGEANSLKRRRIGAPASMDDLDAGRAKAQDLSQQVSQNETRLVLARARLAQLQEELAGEGQDGGAVDEVAETSDEYSQAIVADSRAMAQYEAEYARYTAQQQEKVRNGTDVTTRSPAAQEVIRIVSNATLPELQNTAEMPPDDWARQLRAYNSLRGWSTLPALLLLSNRLGERYNRKRHLDEDTPLLADVKNPLLYAWYRMTDGPDNVEDAYRGEAAVLHTLYPFGAVMLTACFVKMSLIEDGGLLTTIANRWATTMAARTYDTVTNVQAQAAAADKVVRFATGYDNTTAFDVAAASANTPQAAVVAASLATKLFGGPVVAGAATAAVAVWNNPHETHETIENMYTGVALAGDAMETTAWEASLPALMPSGQSVPSTALSDLAGMEVTPEYLADVGQTGLGLVATVLEVGLVYTGRRLGLPEVDRSSAWVELVEARATPVELTCLRNAKPAER